MEKLYFVTSNKGKVAEAAAILDVPIEAVEADLVEIQSLDLEEIVRDKAQRVFTIVGRPLIVDDVALRVDAWNGFPGPYGKYLLQTAGNQGFLKMMETETNRRVAAIAAIGFHDGKSVHTFVGETKGELTLELRGNQGFGWDAIFRPEGSDKTYGEMTLEEKNTVSYRRRALDKFKEFLNT